MAETIISVIKKFSEQKPDELACTFICDSGVIDALTYKQLYQQITAIANFLQNSNAASKRCLISLRPGLSYITSFLGCLAAGVIAVPAYPPRNNRHMERLQIIIDDSQSDLIFVQQNIIDKFNFKQNERNPEIIVLEEAVAFPSNGYKELNIQPDDLAYLQYTSGSTGNPKGVMIDHSNIIANLEFIKSYLDDGNEERVCSWLPPYHDMGLIGGILYALYMGAKNYLMAPNTFLMNPFIWLECVGKYQITTIVGPNFAFDLCVDAIPQEKVVELNLSSLKATFNGAEPVRTKTIERFNKKFAPAGLKPNVMFPVYGMAEMTLMISAFNIYHPITVTELDNEKLEQGICEAVSEKDANSNSTRILVACGQPNKSHPIYIVNPDTYEVCPPNLVGEIWASGPSKAKGYWNNSKSTKEDLHAYLKNGGGPFYRTGDLGFLDHDNNLYITSRLKDLLIIRGRNIYPQDIEATVSDAHELLIHNACAAFMLTEQNNDKLIIVQEVKRQAKDFNFIFERILSDLIAIDDVMPYEIVLIRQASLPKTSSGKVQRRLTRQELANGELTIVARWQTPDTDLETFSQKLNDADLPYPQNAAEIFNILCQKVAMLIGDNVNNIDPQMSFSQLGFNSLKVVMFTGNLSRWLKVEVNPAVLWEAPTINSLSEYLAQLCGFKKPARKKILKTAKIKQNEKIAVIGMGCHFPNHANNINDFWDLLINGKDGVTELPANRFNKNKYYDANVNVAGKIHNLLGGFIDDVEYFDPHFFGISSQEAMVLDPQQRLVLQVAWESLENADIQPQTLKGSATGVYIGASHNDYEHLVRESKKNELNAYAGIGNATSAIAGRLSYFLGLHGESEVIDTACSSSLVALHHACRALQCGEIDLALAGGVNIILDPDIFVKLSDAKMLSVDGHCKTFDASANGYVRAEGCGMVVVKRLSDALRDHDNILGIIAGSAVNQDGASNGLTAPNGDAQESLYLQALKNAHISPNEIDYIETHGTGTILGDPIEVRSLNKVYGRMRKEDHSLILGAVKSNIGHLEPAAGIAGFIKLLLALKHQIIPPNLHYKRLNPNIDIKTNSTVIPTKPYPWKLYGKNRKAAISAFGFTGTNAHIIVEEAKPVKNSQASNSDSHYHLLTLSAKTEVALDAQRQKYISYLRETETLPSFADISFTAQTCREHFNHRIAVVAKDVSEALEHLENHYYESGKILAMPPKIAFLFTGQGSQYSQMGKELYESSTLFKEIIDECDSILKRLPFKTISLKDVLFKESYEDCLNSTKYTQLSLFCLEYALAKWWQSLNISPNYVLGHSIGEIVAATIANVFSLEDALRLVTTRSELMGSLPEGSSMIAVIADNAKVEEIVKNFNIANAKDIVEIAAYNSHKQVAISGTTEALALLTEQLQSNKIKVVNLKVSHAFHSKFMEPILEDFRKIADTIKHNPPTIKLVSNVTGALIDELHHKTTLNGKYWADHIRRPVKFIQGFETLLREGCTVFIEIGPDPILTTLAKSETPKELNADFLWINALQHKGDASKVVQTALGRAHKIGLPIDWDKYHRQTNKNHQKVLLPTYPFQVDKYWIMSIEDLVENQTSPQIEPCVISNALKKGKFVEALKHLVIANSNPSYEIEKSFLENDLTSLQIVSIFQAIEKKWQLSVTEHFEIETLIATPTNQLAEIIFDQLYAVKQTSRVGEQT